MRRCRDRRLVGTVALAALASGCVTGLLFAAGRRREYARDVRAVTATADGTVVDYTADVTDDDGALLATVERRARLAGHPAAIPVRRLTRTWTAPWVFPLVPVTLALDVVVVPVLTFLAPVVLRTGD